MIITAAQNRENEQKNENTKLPGLKANEGSQGVQQQIQSILEQIKKIQAQINAQQGTKPSTSYGY